MKEEEVRAAFAMPVASPLYPRPPLRFIDREFIIITYRTDPDALARVVPAPLKVAEPVVRYEFIKMPDSGGLGSYTESGQVIPVTLNGQAGGYTHAMYLDNVPGVISGREVLGFPKAFGQPKLEVRHDSLVATLDYNGVRVATATMAYKYATLDAAAMKKSLEMPGYLLKVIPHVDGSPRICELVKYKVANLIVKGAWTGPASLELHPHCLAPVATLPVLEVLSAVHILTDLSLDYGEVVHDYLAPALALGA
jgi:acetoacetate decarboxylase